MVKKIKKKIAFIIGITGKEEYYIVELLLKKNYEVHRLIRKKRFYNMY